MHNQCEVFLFSYLCLSVHVSCVILHFRIQCVKIKLEKLKARIEQNFARVLIPISNKDSLYYDADVTFCCAENELRLNAGQRRAFTAFLIAETPGLPVAKRATCTAARQLLTFHTKRRTRESTHREIAYRRTYRTFLPLTEIKVLCALSTRVSDILRPPPRFARCFSERKINADG